MLLGFRSFRTVQSPPNQIAMPPRPPSLSLTLSKCSIMLRRARPPAAFLKLARAHIANADRQGRHPVGRTVTETLSRCKCRRRHGLALSPAPCAPEHIPSIPSRSQRDLHCIMQVDKLSEQAASIAGSRRVSARCAKPQAPELNSTRMHCGSAAPLRPCRSWSIRFLVACTAFDCN